MIEFPWYLFWLIIAFVMGFGYALGVSIMKGKVEETERRLRWMIQNCNDRPFRDDQI